jgi:hypothetical protein
MARQQIRFSAGPGSRQAIRRLVEGSSPGSWRRRAAGTDLGAEPVHRAPAGTAAAAGGLFGMLEYAIELSRARWGLRPDPGALVDLCSARRARGTPAPDAAWPGRTRAGWRGCSIARAGPGNPGGMLDLGSMPRLGSRQW